MARNTGIFNFAGNFEVKKTAPLDARVVVGTKLELTSTATWADSDNNVWLYDGLVVAVTEASNYGLYMLTNYDPVSAPTAYTDAENWVQIDATAAVTDVVDSLESTATNKALSANQGKVLSEKIETLKSSLGTVYNYKGSKDTWAELPSNATAGDVWNVNEAHDNVPAGTNWAWDGSKWDALGGTIDLSDYYTKTEADAAIEEAIGEALEENEILSDIEELQGQVAANSSALQIINSDSEDQAGSLKKVLKDAKDYADAQLTNYVEKVEGSSLITSEKLELIDTNASDIAELKTSVEANTAGLLKLNGNENQEGSVLNIVKTKIEAALDWQEL